jgi:hypothetical protein
VRAKAKVASGERSEFNLLISTAPCKKCSRALSKRLTEVKAGLNPKERSLIDFRLLSTRVYETGHTKDLKKWERHRELSTSNKAVMELVRSGWNMSQLDVDLDTYPMRIWARYLKHIHDAIHGPK